MLSLASGRRLRPLILVAMPACVVVLPSVALAQSAGTAVTLPDVVVSVGRGTSLDKLDVGTTVITREQIENSPELTTDQILNKVPGVFIPSQPSYQLQPTQQELSLRGFGSATNEQVLVLVDGIPINDPFFRTVNWSQIPKDRIERIEIIRGGGATSLWGNLAMGGVINIVTRRPGDREGTAQASYGSFNTMTGDASVGYKITDLWRVGLTYDGLRSDGYNQTPGASRAPLAGGGTPFDATSSVIDNFTAGLFFTPNGTSSYFLKYTFNRIAEHGLIYDEADNYWSTSRVQLGGTTEIAPRTSVNVNAFFQGNTYGTQNAAENGRFSTYSVGSGGATGLSVPIVTLQEAANYQTAGASAFIQSAQGNFSDIKVGVDVRNIWLSDQAQGFRARATCAGGVCTGDIDASAQHRFEGIFGQATYRVAPLPVAVTLGLREDFWQAFDAKTNDIGVGQVLPDTTSAHFDPRLGLKYDLGHGIDLRAAAYENFSAPGLNQMYRSFLTSAFTIANPTLRPQTNFGEEVGADYKSDTVNVSGTLFRNNVDNYIDFVPGLACTGIYAAICTQFGASGGARQYQNVGKALIQGAEVYGDWRVLPTVTLKAGYSLTDARLTRATASATGAAGLDTVNSQLGQIPRYIVTVGAEWQATSKLSFTFLGKGLATYYQYTNHAYQQADQGAFTADIAVRYKVNPHFEVFASVQNIGNAVYYDEGAILGVGGVPPQIALPRTGTVGLKATF